jgi:hypothetical protein
VYVQWRLTEENRKVLLLDVRLARAAGEAAAAKADEGREAEARRFATRLAKRDDELAKVTLIHVTVTCAVRAVALYCSRDSCMKVSI